MNTDVNLEITWRFHKLQEGNCKRMLCLVQKEYSCDVLPNDDGICKIISSVA